MEYKHDNVTIQCGKEVTVQQKKGNNKVTTHTTIQKEEPMNINIIIDNVMHYYYKQYKLTIDNMDKDKNISLYSSISRIGGNIILPLDKQMIIVVDNPLS